MSTTDTRAAFEKRFGPNDSFAWRDENDNYKVASLQSAWEVWQAATEAAKATGTAGEPDADAEMEKVKHDVELMGVGFLVDGRRCSLDRITWFNRPGDTWLPPPPGYTAEAARQPAPAVAVKTWHDRTDCYADPQACMQAMKSEIADLRAALAATAAPVLGLKMICDPNMPSDQVEFRMNGETVGRIVNIAATRSQPCAN